MNLLFRVVCAAHANGSHHKLALDSLRRLKGPDAEKWQRVVLEHVALYMEGAKAPDDDFKDFCNHVLHVRDGYWGGAPDKVESWYGRLVDALKGQRWSEAVYCAGVLSHYFVDPIHPFHTAQSEAENNIHRAVEWSINRSYNDLVRIADSLPAPLIANPEPGAKWLRDLVCRGADTSNKYYETLIAHYDFNLGVVDPPAGLDQTSRRIVAELICYATHSYAAVLERAIKEAAVAPPEVNLTLDTAMALLQIPLKWMQKRLADAEDRRIVEAMYDELVATGRVEKNLPEDDRMVRDAHALAVMVPRTERLEQKRLTVVEDVAADKAPPARQVISGTRLPPAPAAGAAAPTRAEVAAPPPPKPASPPPRPVLVEPPAPVPAAAADREEEHEEEALATGATFRLKGSDDVEAGPSIGPRMAERLAAIGIKTVDDLLAGDAEGISLELGLRHVSIDVVRDWQDQARLVMTVPSLRGGHAQLLVGAGYRSLDDINAASADKLCADVLGFAVTPEGRRILREGNPPKLEAIKAIAERARQQTAA